MRLQILLAALALVAADAAALTKTVIFVAQTPTNTGEADIATVTGTFSTHLPSLDAAPRGGTLMILYAGQTVPQDLLAQAIAHACANALPTCSLGQVAVDGGNVLTNAHAVREPTVHWDGNKVIFGLLTKVAPAQYQQPNNPRWQIYEIEGLADGATRVLTKVPNQPTEYNNVSPVYASDDKIFLTSDRPITGNPIHYPQIEEYESGPTVSGLWKLDPATGALTLLDHSPSGLFTPFVDSFGQVLFTRWDHLQQDQQALNAVAKALNPAEEDYFRAYTYLHENDVGESQREFVEDFVRRKTALNTPRNDMQAWGAGETAVPEYHGGHPVLVGAGNLNLVGQAAGIVSGRAISHYTPQNKYGRYDSLRFNLFVPWQINQDGTGHETFRHMGRQDVGMYSNTSYLDDPALQEFALQDAPMGGRDGYFQLTEYPLSQAPGGGTYVGIASAEFGTHASGFILRMRDTGQAVSENGKAVAFDKLTDPASPTRFRNPVMLSDGTLIAALNTVVPGDPQLNQRVKFRLYRLTQPGGTGFYVPDPQPLVPSGVSRNFNYWSPDAQVNFNGPLWEISPVEVRVRPRPTAHLEPALPAPELQAFTDAGVNVAQFKQYLRDNDLALIVSRNVTRRDEADRQQPSNLQVDPQNVPVGQTAAKTIRTGQAGAKVYDVAKLQLYQNDLVRGYDGHASGSGASFKDNGRRGLARPMHAAGALAANPPSPGVPGARIAFDGSFAAFVPAKRAITWTLADKDEAPVVRERYWLTFAPGEVRVCASCHGVNEKAQDGTNGAAQQTPQALRDLLDYWKKSESGASSIITHYYQSLLRRAPDAGGQQFWEDESLRMRAGGASVNEALFAMSAAFLTSAEYASFNRDNAGFVTDLYTAFFDRAPDSGGLAFWTSQIAQGMPREVVYVSFLFSPEFDGFTRGVFGPTAGRSEVDTVLDFYRGLLGRLPDAGGLDAWLRAFRLAQCDGAPAVAGAVQSISSAFADSGEYAARGRSNAQYVGDLYNAFLRRGGDSDGVAFWVNQLNSGASRASLRQSFIASPEFNARVQKMSSEACLF